MFFSVLTISTLPLLVRNPTATLLPLCFLPPRWTAQVIEAIRGMGISTMRIFLHGNRLFMYAEAPDDFDPARDYAKYAARWAPHASSVQLTSPE